MKEINITLPDGSNLVLELQQARAIHLAYQDFILKKSLGSKVGKCEGKKGCRTCAGIEK